VGTGVAADARDAVVEHTAREERVGDLRHDRAPRVILAREALVVDRRQAVQMVRHQSNQRRGLRASSFVDVARPRTLDRPSARPVTVSLRDRLVRRSIRVARASRC